MAEKQILNCSFCGKNQEDVKKLIAGPNVYICDECIFLCIEILAEEGEIVSHACNSIVIILNIEDVKKLFPEELMDKLNEYAIQKKQEAARKKLMESDEFAALIEEEKKLEERLAEIASKKKELGVSEL